MVNNKTTESYDLDEYRKEVITSHKEYFNYQFQILASIEQKVSNYINIVLITETIIVTFIGILIKFGDNTIYNTFLIIMLIVSGLILGIACWLIISILNPHEIKLPSPLKLDSDVDNIYQNLYDNLKESIDQCNLILNKKTKKFKLISTLIFWSIISSLNTMIISLIIYLIQ